MFQFSFLAIFNLSQGFGEFLIRLFESVLKTEIYGSFVMFEEGFIRNTF